MNVYTLSGKAITLGAQPLASGGEGAVYDIVGYPKKVVKKYHTDAHTHQDKITRMVQISQENGFHNARLADVVAWPLSPVFDDTKQFIGFGMNKISARHELNDLYVYPPKNNRKVTVTDKITCAISLCDIVERLHDQNLCFGDGNPVNLRIDDNFNVFFLDADSFHFSRGGRLYKCEVCASGYVAPELITKCRGTTYGAYPGETFNKYTDRFSLAIHIFRLLFNGAHPFICQRQLKRAGSAPAPKSMDKRVEAGETPFFKTIPDYTTPGYAPDIGSIPPYIRDLFERAFVDGHTDPPRRPTAWMWKQGLMKLRSELTHCRKNPAHHYWNGASRCPYCEADARYAQGMNQTLANPVGGRPRTANIPQPIPAAPTNTPTYTPVPNPTRGTSGATFWIVTLLLTVLLLSGLSGSMLPELVYALTEDNSMVDTGVILCCIAGGIGTLVYNSFWAPGRLLGSYAWWEYLLSLLTCVGFMIGVGLFSGLLSLLFYAFIACMVIAAIAALFSGG